MVNASDGATLYCELWSGESGLPKLIVINGTGTDLRDNRYKDILGMLSGQFTVLTYEHRGMGQSAMDKDDEYSMAKYASDCKAVQEAFGECWQKPYVFGYSFGGMVAQEFAVTYPDSLSHLILCCTSPGGAYPSYPLHQLYEKHSCHLDKPPCYAKGRFMEDFVCLVDKNTPFLVKKIAGFLGNFGAIDPPAAAHPNYRACFYKQLLARAKFDATDRLSRIEVPTIVFYGDRDAVVNQEHQKAFRSGIKGQLKISVLTGSHLFFAPSESGKQVMQEMNDFMADK